ncbi:hypothetical protein FB451DRAFT_1438821 [Mycena latifolia]|nr:hypothetical protein FB451DRAFT_1438821 [Mycena latifolia]
MMKNAHNGDRRKLSGHKVRLRWLPFIGHIYALLLHLEQFETVEDMGAKKRAETRRINEIWREVNILLTSPKHSINILLKSKPSGRRRALRERDTITRYLYIRTSASDQSERSAVPPLPRERSERLPYNIGNETTLRPSTSQGRLLVLGANIGIGLKATKHFAMMNPGRLILACRNQSKGQAAVEKLKADTGYSKSELWIVDRSRFRVREAVANKFEQDGENATVGLFDYEPTKDGFETSLQVSNLSTPLLALLLLPRMIQMAQEHATVPRTIVVSSSVHYWLKIEKSLCEDPEMLKTMASAEYCTPKEQISSHKAYGFYTSPHQSLNNALHSSQRFLRPHVQRASPPTTPLIVDAVCPGYCYSELRRNFTGIVAMFDAIMEWFLAFTSERGSRKLMYTRGKTHGYAYPRIRVPIPTVPATCIPVLVATDLSHPRVHSWDALCGRRLRIKTFLNNSAAYIFASHVEEVADFVLSPEGAKAQDNIWVHWLDRCLNSAH